jgi:hypothetical protein
MAQLPHICAMCVSEGGTEETPMVSPRLLAGAPLHQGKPRHILKAFRCQACGFAAQRQSRWLNTRAILSYARFRSDHPTPGVRRHHRGT